MWEERHHIYGIPGVHNNFPFKDLVLRNLSLSKKKKKALRKKLKQLQILL